MNIRLNEDIKLEFENILFLNGANKTGKTFILKTLENGFNGELENFYVNNNRVYKGDYKTFYIGDYNNFATEFKLTKTNIFKKLIYDSILEKINTEELLEKVNKIFDTIDSKINANINKEKMINNIKLDINVDSIDKVIEKFTDIYVDDYLLDDKITPRSTLRKLLINLTLYQIQNNNNNKNIVLIDDFDSSFNEKELYEIIKLLEKNKDAVFIVTSSRNIYNFIKNKNNLYKVFNKKANKITTIENSIKHSIILNEYNLNNSKEDFNSFLEENEYLINEEDIRYFKENILTILSFKIGLLYSNDNVEISTFNEEKETFIKVKNNLEKVFLEILYKNLIKEIDKE